MNDRSEYFSLFRWLAFIAACSAFIVYQSWGSSERQAAYKKEQEQKDAESEMLSRARFELRCQLLGETMQKLRSVGSTYMLAPVDTDESCRRQLRLLGDGCPNKVAIMLEMAKATPEGLHRELQRYGDDCSADFSFASKHGLRAYLDHEQIVQEAIENTRGKAP